MRLMLWMKRQENRIKHYCVYHSTIVSLIQLKWRGRWSKEHVKANNTTYKINDVRQLLNEGVQKNTPEMWSNFITLWRMK